MGSDDYILVTGSHNLNDDKEGDDGPTKEGDESSLRALEKQGIFLEPADDAQDITSSGDEFSKKLEEIGGIEIIPSETEDSDTGY